MFKAIQLILSPFNAWTKVVADQRGVAFILGCSLLPLILLCVGLEGWSLMRWGEQRGELGHLIKISQAVAVRYAATQAALFLVCVFASAFTVQAVARSFNLSATFCQAFTAVAYGIGPIILMRLVDAVPFLPSWGCWGIGALLTASVLYHGIALALKPDQTKGFGLYLITIMIVLLSTGVAHLLALAVLHEKLLR